ncbi:transketolase [Bacteroides graminisolvens DSM 19988 = JCM 15093]|uniref:Transketolase n=1 Tax=Bacteroides graminisolvens DSM 19988 = JCM 15093 TaxID=1121097 RepID=A0A069D3K6_9BACE|nr:transketolase [Bacteroides graminisolvens DSM 19988 = JCM 15093]
MNDNKLMNRAADNIRILAASMVEKANSGHPGGAMGGADFVNVLFSEFLVFDPKNLNGKVVTASFLTQVTCLQCYILC